MKKYIFAAALLLLALCAVSCSSEPADPVSGMYQAAELKVSSSTFPAAQFYPDGAFVRLDRNGKGLFSLGSGKSELSWALDGHEITIECDGFTTAGTLYREALALDSILGTDMDMTFVKADTPVNDYGKIEVPDGMLGEYSVRFVGADSFTPQQAEEGESGLNVYLEFTNLSPLTKMCGSVIHLTFYQNGKELSPAITPKETEEYTARTLLVRPGCAVRCAKTAVFRPENGKITVVATAWQTDPMHCVIAEFDPAALPGAPSETFEYPGVPEPQWAAGFSPDGDLGSYHVKAAGVDTFPDGGITLGRLHVSITNNSAEDMIPYQKIAVRFFQDGIQLPIRAASSENVVDSDFLYYEMIRPGEEKDATLTYPLRSMNPVEVEIVDEKGEQVYGGVFPLN